MKEVAIVYHYLAHYRLPIFRELCLVENPRFTIISDKKGQGDILTIDCSLAGLPVVVGGLRWNFITNFWIKKEKILWQKGLIAICLSNRFDEYIFLGNPYFLTTWIATIILRLRNRKVYFWTHGLLKESNGFKGFIRKLFHKLPDGFLLYGNYAKDLMIKEGFNQDKLHVIYNSLDYNKQISLRGTMSEKEVQNFKATLFKYPHLPQLVFIGRLSKQKKIDILIEAVSALHQKDFPVNLLLVGEGIDKSNLLSLVEAKNIVDHVLFYGDSYNEEENYKLIVSSDICVSPGEVGLTAMHSLVYGTPLITHNNFNEQMPEFESIIPGLNGDFFEQNNIFDLSDKICKWINLKSKNTEVKQNCYKIIDLKYNPRFQKDEICKIILG